MKPVRVKDIAQACGVSEATVSMVLNGRAGIGEQTRRRVLETAQKMGYEHTRRRSAAQNERQNGRTLTYLIYRKHGLVVGDTPFFEQLMEGIASEANQEGYQLQVAYYYEDQDEEAQLASLRQLGSDGIILLATEIEGSEWRRFTTLSVPLLLLDSYQDSYCSDSVIINNVQGAYLATSSLLERGFRQIGHLRSSIRIHNFRERAEVTTRPLKNGNSPSSVRRCSSLWSRPSKVHTATCLATSPNNDPFRGLLRRQRHHCDFSDARVEGARLPYPGRRLPHRL